MLRTKKHVLIWIVLCCVLALRLVIHGSQHVKQRSPWLGSLGGPKIAPSLIDKEKVGLLLRLIFESVPILDRTAKKQHAAILPDQSEFLFGQVRTQVNHLQNLKVSGEELCAPVVLFYDVVFSAAPDKWAQEFKIHTREHLDARTPRGAYGEKKLGSALG
jgi:hypothetical protein